MPARALIMGGLWFAGTGVVEVAGLMFGLFTLEGEEGLEGFTYPNSPDWLYLALPVVIGLFAVLWYWNKGYKDKQNN